MSKKYFNLFLVFCLAYQGQYMFANTELETPSHVNNELISKRNSYIQNLQKQRSQLKEGDFISNDFELESLQNLLDLANSYGEAAQDRRVMEQTNNNLKSSLLDIGTFTPIIGPAFTIIDKWGIDKDKPNQNFTNYSQDQIQIISALQHTHPQMAIKIYESVPKLIKGSQNNTNKLLLGNDKSLMTLSNQTSEKLKNVKEEFELMRQEHVNNQNRSDLKLKKLYEDMVKSTQLYSTAQELIHAKDQIMRSNFLTTEDKEDFITASETILNPKKESSIKIEASRVITNLVNKNINEALLHNSSKLENLEKKTDQKAQVSHKKNVNIAGYSFEFDPITEPGYENFVDALGVAYAVASILNSISSLSSDPNFKKTTNDFFAITSNVIILASSISTIAAGGTAVAMAGAMATGVGAVVAIAVILSTSKKKGGMDKVFNSLFQQLDHIISQLNKVLENQDQLLANQNIMVFRQKLVLKKLNQIRAALHELSLDEQQNHNDLLKKINELTALNHQIFANHQEINIFEKINNYLSTYTDPLHALKRSANNVSNKMLFTIPFEEIKNVNKNISNGNQYISDLNQEKSKIIDELYIQSQKLGSFLTKNYDEAERLDINHKLGENIFNSSKIDEYISVNQIRSIYSPPNSNKTMLNQQIQNVYESSPHLIVHDINKMYNWILESGELTTDFNNTASYEYTIKNEQNEYETHSFSFETNRTTNIIANEVVLYNITEKYYEIMKSFRHYFKSIPKKIITLLKKRLYSIKQTKNNYRAILPIAVDQYRKTIEKMSHKLHINASTQKQSAYLLVQKIFKLEQELSKIAHLEKNNKNMSAFNSKDLDLWRSSIGTGQFDHKERFIDYDNDGNFNYENQSNWKNPNLTEYNYVNVNRIFFHKQITDRFIDYIPKDIRATETDSPSEKSVEKSQFEKRGWYIHPMTSFIDVNPLGKLIENLALDFGLIKISKQNFEMLNNIENKESYQLFHQIQKANKDTIYGDPVGYIQVIHPIVNKNYNSKYQIMSTDSLAAILINELGLKNDSSSKLNIIDSKIDIERFGKGLQPEQLKNESLLYTGYINGRLSFPATNYVGIDIVNSASKKLYWQKYNTKHFYNYKEKQKELALSYLSIPRVYTKEYESFTKIYANGIEKGVGFLKTSLVDLLRLLKYDLAQIYEIAASSPTAELDTSILKLNSYYELNNIDVFEMFSEIQEQLYLASHYKLAIAKFIDYSYKGCEDILTGISQLFHISKLSSYDEIAFDVNTHLVNISNDNGEVVKQSINYFKPGEAFNNHKLNEYFSGIKDLNIGFQHLQHPFLNTLSGLPTTIELINDFNKSKNHICGQTTYRGELIDDSSGVNTSYITIKGSASDFLNKIELFEKVSSEAISDY